MLDTTGSMANATDGKSKMQALQEAATKAFVDYVFADAKLKSNSKISLVPFATAVAVDPSTYRNASWIDGAGSSSYHRKNINKVVTGSKNFNSRLDIFTTLAASKSGWDWAGCLKSLPYPLNVPDGSPLTSNPDSYLFPCWLPMNPEKAAPSRAAVASTT